MIERLNKLLHFACIINLNIWWGWLTMLQPRPYTARSLACVFRSYTQPDSRQHPVLSAALSSAYCGDPDLRNNDFCKFDLLSSPVSRLLNLYQCSMIWSGLVSFKLHGRTSYGQWSWTPECAIQSNLRQYWLAIKVVSFLLTLSRLTYFSSAWASLKPSNVDMLLVNLSAILGTYHGGPVWLLLTSHLQSLHPAAPLSAVSSAHISAWPEANK